MTTKEIATIEGCEAPAESEPTPAVACEEKTPPSALRYRVSKKLYVTRDVHRGFLLVYNLRRGTIRRCSTTFWRALKFEGLLGGYIGWRPELKDLVRDKFLVPIDEDEQEETLQEKLVSLEKGKIRQLYWSFWPSADCNLACDYCGQSHSNTVLSREHCDLAARIVRKRLETHGFKKFHVSWFGGEPLLGIKVIRYLTPQFFKISKDLGIPFDARMISNATLLTKEIAQELVNQLGIVWIDVTLDGPQHVHDKRRCTQEGNGTYERILKNLETFFEIRKSKQQATVTLRCNIDMRNIDAVKELIDDLERRGFNKEISRIQFAAIFPWGQSTGQRHRFTNQKKYSRMSLDIALYALSKGFGTHYMPLGCGTGCQAADLNSSVNVLPGGRLYRCGEIPLTDMCDKNYPWWDMGTLEELAERDEKEIQFSSDWYEELSQRKWRCMQCRFFGVCSGECPRQHRQGGNPCPPYIPNLAERMRAYSKLNLPIPEKGKDRLLKGLVPSRIMKLFGSKSPKPEA